MLSMHLKVIESKNDSVIQPSSDSPAESKSKKRHIYSKRFDDRHTGQGEVYHSFCAAAERLDVEAMQNLIIQYPDYDFNYFPEKYGAPLPSILMLAIHGRGYRRGQPIDKEREKNRLKIVTLILEQDADVNYVARWNHTALSIASWAGYTDIMKMLLERGATIENARGGTDEARALLEAFKRKSFYQQYKGQVVQIENKLYGLVKSLENRGQSAKAGFYQCMDENKSYVIKQDPTHVCVQEGSADWVLLLIPYKKIKKVLNFSHCAALTCINAEGKNDEKTTPGIITIQPALVDVKPLDKVILGRSRISYWPISEEHFHRKEIANFIEECSVNVKSDLAHALFYNKAMCNESVHLGQFMVSMDKNEVTKMIGIDLAAQGRFGYGIVEDDDFTHFTTKRYAQIGKLKGQLKKDYISYYLQDPDVNIKYMSLWAQLREKDIEKALGKKIESFRKQIEIVKSTTPKLLQKTLNEIYDIYTKDSSKTREKEKNITQEELESMMILVHNTHLIKLRTSARKRIEELFERMESAKPASDNDTTEDEIENKKEDKTYLIEKDDYRHFPLSSFDLSEMLELIQARLTVIVEEKNKNEIDKIISDCIQYLSYFKLQMKRFGIKDDSYSLDFPGEKIKKLEMNCEIELLRSRISMIKQLRKYANKYPDVVKKAIGDLISNKDPSEVVELLSSITIDNRYSLHSQKIEKELIDYLKKEAKIINCLNKEIDSCQAKLSRASR